MAARNDFKIWAFSNENLTPLTDKLGICGAEICGLAGAGDQGFSFLSLGAKNYLGFEEREKALNFVDFKKTMLQELEREEFVSAFKNELSGKEIFKRIKDGLSKKETHFWQDYLEKKRGLVVCLKKSGLFYNYSFKNFQKRDEFFPYLKSEKNYRNLQENLDSFQTQSGSIQKQLQSYENEFDLLYLSNILDSTFQSKTYLENLQPLLNYASKALKLEGRMIALTLKRKKLVERLKGEGIKFELVFKPSFGDWFFFTFGGSYPYSIILIEPLS